MTLEETLARGPYQAYVYAYPHKTAYRPFAQPLALHDLWREEPQQSLFLYLHVPFCTMRCGFCNLFTQASASESLVRLYLDALREQALQVHECLPGARFSRLALGGGTPTYLNADELAELFSIAHDILGVGVPSGIEVSPDTVSEEKLAVCRRFGVERISMGVQSFFEKETRDCGRPQSPGVLSKSLELLCETRFPILNLDLIYGLPGQTVTSFLASVEKALTYSPEELFLYPLYVRPLTGLGRSRKEWDDVRVSCYREGRRVLLSSGYQQVSMRMFRRSAREGGTLPTYCCQTDGMVGLGCGARSYTRGVHYSLDYAVTPKSVKEIIADYVARPAESFAFAHNGFTLNEDEQRRRFVLQSLFHISGFSNTRYQQRFGTDVRSDFPELHELESRGFLQREADDYFPTALGLELSDAIGPWLFSPRVQQLIQEYEHR